MNNCLRSIILICTLAQAGIAQKNDPFRGTYNKINQVLNEDTDFSFKEIVFDVENAYVDGVFERT